MPIKIKKSEKPSVGLWTIGHGKDTSQQLIDRLRVHGITLYVDVRSYPSSKANPHHNRARLCESLEEAGISYLYGGKFLGGMNHLTVQDPNFVEKIKKVHDLAQINNLALACAEPTPRGCHRAYKLSQWLALHQPLQINHVLPDGSLLSHQDLLGKVQDDWGWHEFGGKYK